MIASKDGELSNQSITHILKSVICNHFCSPSKDMDTGDDGGGGGDMADVMDPSLMDIDTAGGGLMGPGGLPLGGQKKLANLKVQTLLALQELGIVIAVAFMVGGIFMLMIFVEKIWDQVMTAYQKKFGGYKENEYDVEDPAALVGTFKRYKN